VTSWTGEVRRTIGLPESTFMHRGYKKVQIGTKWRRGIAAAPHQLCRVSDDAVSPLERAVSGNSNATTAPWAARFVGETAWV